MPVTGVIVTDTLPAGVQYLTSSVAPSIEGKILTWYIGPMTANQTVVITITVGTTGLETNQSIINSARIQSSGDSLATGNNISTLTTSILLCQLLRLQRRQAVEVEEVELLQQSYEFHNLRKQLYKK